MEEIDIFKTNDDDEISRFIFIILTIFSTPEIRFHYLTAGEKSNLNIIIIKI